MIKGKLQVKADYYGSTATITVKQVEVVVHSPSLQIDNADRCHQLDALEYRKSDILLVVEM